MKLSYALLVFLLAAVLAGCFAPIVLDQIGRVN